MKILITGGAGFIGAHLTIELISNGHEVIVLDKLSPQIHGANKDKSYLFNLVKDKSIFIEGNILFSETLNEFIKEIDVVVHLAAETGTGQSMYNIYDYVNNNSLGTARILEMLVKCRNSVKKFVLASSRAIYGEGAYYCYDHNIVYPGSRSIDDMRNGDFECKCPYCNSKITPIPTNENSKVSPKSIYGITKYNQEQLVKSVCASINVPYTIFRFQNVYGRGQSISNPYTGILSIFSSLIMQNRKLNIFEDGDESRDFIHVQDVVDSIIMDINSQSNNEVYNVGTGQRIKVIHIAQTLYNLFEKTENYEISGDFRIGDIRHNYADIKNIQDKLGFNPRIKFDDGLKDLVNWINETVEIEEMKYENSIAEMKKLNLLIRKATKDDKI